MDRVFKVIRRIVTHFGPHLDDLAAIWLLIRWGRKFFTNIDYAPVEVWRKGGATPDGRSFESWEDEGTMFVGVGRGQFDDHPLNGQDDQGGKCATVLVAERLGIADDPALQPILEYVQKTDKQACADVWGLAAMVKALNEVKMEHNRLLAWVCAALDAKYNQQVQYIKAETDAAAAQWDDITSGGRRLKMATVESDNTQIHKLLFTKGASVVVLRNSQTGQVMIFTQKRDNVRITDAVRIIRILEQRARGDVVVTNWKQLAAPGTIDAIMRWHYLKEGEMLLNGSLAHPDVPATGLSLETIRQSVLLALSNRMICPQADTCCGKSCSWYQLGLSRCQKLRYDTSHAQPQ